MGKSTRREALLLSAAGGLGAAFARLDAAPAATESTQQQRPGLCSTPRSAVAQTQYGIVRGYEDDGVLTFKGVPYGQDTGGEHRWLPCKPPTPWDGERPTQGIRGKWPQAQHR